MAKAAQLARCRVPLTEERLVPTPLDVLKEYAAETTLHGVRYITKEDIGIVDRLCWIVALVVCVTFAGLFVNSAWVSFMESPTVTSVESTHYALYEFPFPAVTVCSTNRVKKTVGQELLLKYLNATLNDTLEDQLWNMMSALSIFQHPFYIRMDEHLDRIKDILPRFDSLNVTDFMIKVLPTCEELFHSCFWHGQALNCCSVFHLQRSEAGFCYSFNSLTSENAKHCSTQVDMLASGGASVIVSKQDANCLLRRNTAAGTTTGLEVFINPSLDVNQLGSGQRDGKGVRILVHHPSNFPEAGRDMFVPERRKYDIAQVFTVKVSPSVTISTPAVRSLDPYERHCFFPDERRLRIHRTYGLLSCLIECRQQYIAEHCHCRPYFFDIDPDLPECKLNQLKCITRYSVDMRFFSAPSDTVSFEQDNAKLRCVDCLPTCHEILFNVDSSFAEDSNPGSEGSAAYIDVYYKDLGAVKYRRDVAFGSMQLLVSFGGIIGLFLGVSLLSGAELLYYIARLTTCVFRWLWWNNPQQVQPISVKPQPNPDIISHIAQSRLRGFTELESTPPKRFGISILGLYGKVYRRY